MSRLISRLEVRRRWPRCAATSATKTSPSTMCRVKTNSKVNEVMAVAMRPRCTSQRRVGFEIVIGRDQLRQAALGKFIRCSLYDRKIVRSTYLWGKTLMMSEDARFASGMFLVRSPDPTPKMNAHQMTARENRDPTLSPGAALRY